VYVDSWIAVVAQVLLLGVLVVIKFEAIKNVFGKIAGGVLKRK